MYENLKDQYIYVAHPDFISHLCKELGEVSAVYGNLVFSPLHRTSLCFAQDYWFEAKLRQFESIGEAAKILRAEKIIWHPVIIECARRSLLIAEKLPIYRDKALTFPIQKKLPLIGCYSLLDEHHLVYTTKRWKSPPNGEYIFEEDKIHPPNRAYLKLWEALSLLGIYPKAGEEVLDLGASPGGWTYVMQSFGAKVTAVDKAPLDPKIAALPLVSTLLQSAFGLEPQAFQKIDWLICDVACYPERLYYFIEKWLEAQKVKQFICTIKLQGESDFEIIKKFQSIPNSIVLHLFHNKHELTWIHPFIGP